LLRSQNIEYTGYKDIKVSLLYACSIEGATLMKSWITWLSIGSLSAALAATGVISYLAWDSITARTELSRSLITDASRAQPLPSPSPASAPAVQTVAASQPAAQLAAQTNAALPLLTQAENNYLYDLSQALEPAEESRLTSEQKLAIADQVLSWLKQGVNYWGVREKFDATYGSQLAGNYAHNRDVYIRFATEWLAPDHLATLKRPESIAQVPVDLPAELPVEAPSASDQPDFAADPYPYPPPYLRDHPPRPYYPYPPYPRAFSRF
jgi:hypothetical protein